MMLEINYPMTRKTLFVILSFITGGTLLGQNVLHLVDETASFDELMDYEVTMEGNSELHLTGEIASVSGSTFNILSDDSWIFFHEIWPSYVNNDLADQIFVNGEPAIPEQNVRFEQYRHGTAVIPHSPDFLPLMVYGEADYGGASIQMGQYVYYRESELGDMNNQISSFTLKRGYMATFAQGAMGDGYSRVFIAEDEDIHVPEMPEGLDNSVSFVRVFPWKYVSKKGWGGGETSQSWNLMQYTWQYNWNANGSSGLNFEYVPIRHNYYWPNFDLINNIENSTHLLGYNEPERPDQADMTVEQALEQWPRLMESGLRLGSPAPSDAAVGRNWLYEFLDRADELNYRVDYVAMHWYQGGQTPTQFYNRLRQVHERTGRAIWVKEFNNGANWTTHPDPEESADWFAEALHMLDTASFVERYAVFHWMADPFKMYINNELTPAGQVYSDFKAGFAYNPGKEYIMEYIPVPRPGLVQAEIVSAGTKITWIDNVAGSMGLQVERSFEGDDFVQIADIEDVEQNIFIDTETLVGETMYRLRLYTGGEYSEWSDTVSVFKANQDVPYAIDHRSSDNRLTYSEPAGTAVLENADGETYTQKWRLAHATEGQHYIENVAGNVRLMHHPDEGIKMVPRSNTTLNARWEVESLEAGSGWRFLVNSGTGRKLHARHQDNYHVGTTDPQWTGPNVQWKLTPLDPLPPGIIVDARPNNPDHGSVTGGGYFEHDTEVSLTATPNHGYRFLYWKEGQDTISTDATLEFIAGEEDRTIIAHFERNLFTVTFLVQDENEEPIPDAIAVLGSTQNDTGDYVFENIEPGEYSYTIVHTDYPLAGGDIELVDEDISVTVIMKEDDTSLKDITLPAIQAHPNPVRDVLFVTFENHSERPVNVLLLNMHGQSIASKTITEKGPQELQFSIEGLARGLYLLRIDYEGIPLPKKIMVH